MGKARARQAPQVNYVIVVRFVSDESKGAVQHVQQLSLVMVALVLGCACNTTALRWS